MDMELYPILRCILSHEYLVAVILPICIAVASLMWMLLETSATVPSDVVVDAFSGYINASYRRILKDALTFSSEQSFPQKLQEEFLSKFGCRQLASPSAAGG